MHDHQLFLILHLLFITKSYTFSYCLVSLINLTAEYTYIYNVLGINWIIKYKHNHIEISFHNYVLKSLCEIYGAGKLTHQPSSVFMNLCWGQMKNVTIY